MEERNGVDDVALASDEDANAVKRVVLDGMQLHFEVCRAADVQS